MMKRFALLLLAAAVMCSSVGCIKPYDKPEFAEIQHHETGYLIPLEGATKDGQAKFESKEALEENKVAIKRIQIPHRWVKTGRMPRAGHYMDTVRLVVVDRTPVTREWTADAGSGTSTKDQAIWLESRDSIGFSLGFNCTAFIDEEDTSDFLYMYPTTTADTTSVDVDRSIAGLASVMDKEIRARVSMLGNYVASKYDLDDLRAKKQEILDVVRNGVPEETDADGNVTQERLQGTLEHFAARGITISNLGHFGGFEYEETKIQDAINDTFVAQQEKVKTEAAFEAQAKVNERIELEAEATANKARTIAKGTADAVTIAAEAEANAIRLVAEAASEAGKNPLFLQLKELEVEAQRIEMWDGKYPTTLMTLGEGSEAPDLLMNIGPTPSPAG
ncbi:MAG: SPFH domain-containing protein [Planctomycetota bacterium]|jgi:hypothetical protein